MSRRHSRAEKEQDADRQKNETPKVTEPAKKKRKSTSSSTTTSPRVRTERSPSDWYDLCETYHNGDYPSQRSFLNNLPDGSFGPANKSAFARKYKEFCNGTLRKDDGVKRRHIRKFQAIEDKLQEYLEMREDFYKNNNEPEPGLSMTELKQLCRTWADELGLDEETFKASTGWIQAAIRRGGFESVPLYHQPSADDVNDGVLAAAVKISRSVRYVKKTAPSNSGAAGIKASSPLTPRRPKANPRMAHVDILKALGEIKTALKQSRFLERLPMNLEYFTTEQKRTQYSETLQNLKMKLNETANTQKPAGAEVEMQVAWHQRQIERHEGVVKQQMICSGCDLWRNTAQKEQTASNNNGLDYWVETDFKSTMSRYQWKSFLFFAKQYLAVEEEVLECLAAIHEMESVSPSEKKSVLYRMFCDNYDKYLERGGVVRDCISISGGLMDRLGTLRDTAESFRGSQNRKHTNAAAATVMI